MTRAYNTATTQQNSGGAVAGVTAGKNIVINGAMDIWQRGTSFTGGISSAAIGPDRWNVYRNGSGSTFSRQVTNDTTNLPFIQYCTRVQRDSGNTSTSSLYYFQDIESVNSIPFAGKTVTLSFYARKGANFSATTSTILANVLSGTGTDQSLRGGYTNGATPISQNATLTTTWQRFSYTGTVASTATQLGIRFDWDPTGTAGAADYYEVTGVQLEVGSVATPFSRAGGTIQGELAACQRYFFKVGGEIAGQHTIRQGGYYDANYIGFYCPYPVPMRTAPSITAYGTVQVYQSGTAYSGFTWNNTIAGNPSTQNQYIVGTKTSHGLTVNLSCDLYCATTSDYIGVSAEL